MGMGVVHLVGVMELLMRPLFNVLVPELVLAMGIASGIPGQLSARLKDDKLRQLTGLKG